MRTSTFLLGLALAATSGCSLFHGDYPGDECRSDLDCFRAQGEFCNTTIQRCEQKPDAAPIVDAAPRIDARPLPDAEPPPDACVDCPDAEPPPDACVDCPDAADAAEAGVDAQDILDAPEVDAT